jgi:hypothetical protein
MAEGPDLFGDKAFGRPLQPLPAPDFGHMF